MELDHDLAFQTTFLSLQGFVLWLRYEREQDDHKQGGKSGEEIGTARGWA